jgi:ubiquinone biosynthesis monooxygenase Coq7
MFEAQLERNLQPRPGAVARSRAIVARMKEDEARHAAQALAAGAVLPPAPVPALMQLASKVMKAVAYRL